MKMDPADLLRVIESVSNEKGVSEEIIFQAVEAALASAIKKLRRKDVDVRVAMDRATCEYEAFRRWEVVADDGGEAAADSPAENDGALEFPDRQIRLSEARERKADAEVGEYLEEPVPVVEHGRISAQYARQVIIQKVREAERARIYELYQGRVGEMINGVVKSVERSGIVVGLMDGAEGFIPRGDLIPRESARPHDRLRCYLCEVRSEPRGPQLVLSRTATELLLELFRLEVPEIGEGLIEIVSGVRAPGARARIAVRTREPRIDPIGACVGMRGSRVQSVSNELAGERVDIVQWDENPAQYVLNAMVPADIVSVLVDEDARTMSLIVEEENLSQAIGRNGQNVKLASELTGWTLNVMSLEEAKEKNEEDTERLQREFHEQLEVGDEVASILVQEGFSQIEEIAYVPEREILEIEEFDEALVRELRGRAKSWLLTRAIAEEVRLMDVKPGADLLAMEGMDRDLAYRLASQGVVTMQDLADQSVDELIELERMGEERAGRLIMTARGVSSEEEPDQEQVCNA